MSDHAVADGAGKDLLIWFCLYANYQPGDAAGPTINERLAQDPFGHVIRSPLLRYMCLIVTSTQDPYERLCCVYEIHVALEVLEERARSTPQKECLVKIRTPTPALGYSVGYVVVIRKINSLN